ncbi:MAG TPA: glycosyltransferase family 2 protein [Bryobacterales bacterium]|nr:glycosyltransferase family 2 protein [Bryobacterales bacterium]
MAQTGLGSLSVFFPAYNDAPSLPGLVERAFAVAGRLAEDFEVIVVNDGSRDETDRVLAELAARFGPRLRVVRHAANLGYGAAVRSGFHAAAKNYVFYTDGDGQYDVGELPLLAEALGPGVGLVNGYKISRSDVFYRVLIGKAYLWTVRRLFHLAVRDVDCDFRLVKRSLLNAGALESTSGTICVELVRKLQDTGCGVVEVPVHHLPRLHGRSQFFRPLNLIQSVWQLIGLYFRLQNSREREAAQMPYPTESR